MDHEHRYRAATERVALADLSDRGKVELFGPDRVRFANALCTNDLMKVAIGAGCELFFLDVKGRIFDFARLFAMPLSIWLDVEPGRASSLRTHLDHYLLHDQVKLFDQTATWGQLHLLGPQSRSLLAAAIGLEVPDLEDLQHMARTVGGVECQIRRVRRSPEGGWDLLMPMHDLPKVAEMLRTLGTVYGLETIDHDTLEILRVEAGLPTHGVDFGERTLPQELDRNAQAISFTKGCYLGQETVARLDAMGHVNKVLRGVSCPVPAEAPAPVPGTSVLLEQAEVGQVTSLVYSPRHRAYLGLAIVRTKAAEPGTAIALARPDAATIPGVICRLPFAAGSAVG